MATYCPSGESAWPGLARRPAQLSLGAPTSRHPAADAGRADLRRRLRAGPRPAQQARSGEAHDGAVSGAVSVWPHCPYVDNVPPFWSSAGTLDTPARHGLPRPGRAQPAHVRRPHFAGGGPDGHAVRRRHRHLARRPGRVHGRLVGPDHHARHRRVADAALAGLRHPAVQRARPRAVERGADPRRWCSGAATRARCAARCWRFASATS